jgi:hypothetical protein
MIWFSCQGFSVYRSFTKDSMRREPGLAVIFSNKENSCLGLLTGSLEASMKEEEVRAEIDSQFLAGGRVSNDARPRRKEETITGVSHIGIAYWDGITN